MGEIVVGVDGSDHSLRALAWALREADLRQQELVALVAWGYLDQHHSVVGERFDPGYAEADALAALDDFVRKAVGDADADRVHRKVVCDLPAAGLLSGAASASLLVVGARGLGGFRGLLLGSVSHQCVQHAPCPTAVVRTRDAAPRPGPERIVVGVDGSASARSALQWAADEARLRAATLQVVHTWRLPIVGGFPFAATGYDPAEIEAAARHTLDRALSESDLRDIQTVEPLLVSGSPAAALLAIAQDADLLVVGSRGLGGFTGLLLGSVSNHAVYHAECPVVVVPSGDHS